MSPPHHLSPAGSEASLSLQLEYPSSLYRSRALQYSLPSSLTRRITSNGEICGVSLMLNLLVLIEELYFLLYASW